MLALTLATCLLSPPRVTVTLVEERRYPLCVVVTQTPFTVNDDGSITPGEPQEMLGPYWNPYLNPWIQVPVYHWHPGPPSLTWQEYMLQQQPPAYLPVDRQTPST